VQQLTDDVPFLSVSEHPVLETDDVVNYGVSEKFATVSCTVLDVAIAEPAIVIVIVAAAAAVLVDDEENLIVDYRAAAPTGPDLHYYSLHIRQRYYRYDWRFVIAAGVVGVGVGVGVGGVGGGGGIACIHCYFHCSKG
jgi:hypothetical protein